MRIALDAMGTDNCPVADVAGAILAARESADTIFLIGDRARIEAELSKHKVAGLPLEIIHAESAVTMHDKPSQVNRTKKDSSMAVGLNMVKEGKADAFVSAGNTGAALALATLGSLRRIPGVRRPAIASLIRLEDKTLILCDLGANADAKPEWLLQFGILAGLYAQHVLGRPNPTVGLLSNGEEEGKGNELVKEATELFTASDLNFIGNVEPDAMLKGAADVVIADGFVGNIALKSMEALGDTLFRLIRQNIKTGNLLVKLGALLVVPALRKVYAQVDSNEVGGAPLLGVNGVVIIGHGRSTPTGIKNAIKQAHNAVDGNVIAAMRAGMLKYVESDKGGDEA